MDSPARPTDTSRPQALRWRRWLIGLCLLGAVVAAALWFGKEIAADRARQTAGAHLSAGSLGAAEQSLAWAERIDSGDYRTDLLRAVSARRLGERDTWQQAIEAAEQHGAPASNLRLERDLDEFRGGQADSISAEHYDGLTARGAAAFDAADSLVHGLLAKAQQQHAERFVETWRNGSDEAATSYLLGVVHSAAGDREAAKAEFERTLDQQPTNELARFRLARLLEEQSRFDEALEHYAPLLATAPERELWRVNAARVLRKLGRLKAARRVLRPPESDESASSPLAMEMGEIEYESGNYSAAARWFETADLEGAHVAESLRAAASNFAFAGDSARSSELFARIDVAQRDSRLQGELQRRVAIDPSDAIAAAELQHLHQSPEEELPSVLTSPLFARHCGACHGPAGGGDGPAARYLFPRPRNLRADKYRLVSTVSKNPTLADLEQAIRLGIPGTAMPPMPDLPDDQVKALAAEVEQLYRQRFGDSPPSNDQPLPVPDLGKADVDSIARGKTIYFQSGCHHCHSDDGRGANSPAMYDDEGRPTNPRDLVREPMKGGPSAESLYRRIRLGMPGTPHPASPTLNEADLAALVHFCRSLGQELKETLTNHERSMRAARRTVQASNGGPGTPP